MNILVICDGYPSEKEPNIYIFVHRQVLSLKRAGHNVIVLDIDLRSIRWKRKFGFFSETYEGVDIFRFSFPFVTTKFPNLYRVLNQQIAIFAVNIIEKKKNVLFDCVNAHFVKGAGEAAVKLKQRKHYPVIITEHGSKILNDNNHYVMRFVETYKNADEIIVVGNALKDKLDEYEIASEIVPNIIDTNIFKLGQKNNDAYKFLSVGNINKRKRFDLTINAFAQLNKLYSDTHLCIVGQGDLKREMVKLVENLKVSNVMFLDSVDNNKMAELYNSADCFVLPSDYETFGMVYAEAIACGIPVIATDNGGASDIVTEQCGIIVPKNNAEELATAMKKIYGSESKFDREGMHKYIESKFGERAFVEKYEKILYSIVEKEV